MLGEKEEEEEENTSEGLRFGISLHLAFEAYHSKRTKFKKNKLTILHFVGLYLYMDISYHYFNH